MNIKTAINNVFKELKQVLSNPEVDIVQVYNALSKSWGILRIYVKGISKADVERIDHFLSSYNPELYYLSADMIKEGINEIERWDKNNVPSFLGGFYDLIGRLLIYYKPFDDCCDRCQGNYDYFYSEQLEKLVLECRTCSGIYIIPDNISCLYSDLQVGNLRIPTKADLQRMNVID